jgi:galactokinase/mevalonate kinase-like predicted kinase
MRHAVRLRQSNDPGWREREADAFSTLRELLVGPTALARVWPRSTLACDEMVRARSPVRIDLAGGWTDTPPYCLEHGGKVVNLAACLYGAPPIQVTAKLRWRPEIVLRSVDLGTREIVRTYEELGTFARPGHPLALVKAGLALAGFLPRFHCAPGFPSLRAQLAAFGSGLEISIASGVPQGSGLGTSSILAATLLAVLSSLCGLGWSKQDLLDRTLALEQLLTTGGGWQDQAGAIDPGLKFMRSAPGLPQRPEICMLPTELFRQHPACRSVLLYYTGLTRLAKSILAEIVTGMLLGTRGLRHILADIGANAESTREALQRGDHEGLIEAVRRSWLLNQRLDPQVNPPEVEGILSSVEDLLGAAKLLGAGGGGYLLLLAKDERAAVRVKAKLTARPPNARAHFVDFSVSESGVEVTKTGLTNANGRLPGPCGTFAPNSGPGGLLNAGLRASSRKATRSD